MMDQLHIKVHEDAEFKDICPSIPKEYDGMDLSRVSRVLEPILDGSLETVLKDYRGSRYSDGTYQALDLANAYCLVLLNTLNANEMDKEIHE